MSWIGTAGLVLCIVGGALWLLGTFFEDNDNDDDHDDRHP
jgi:hypothetical protein